MYRYIEERLKHWKQQKKRKPLLINGIRQVGKTWSVRDFGVKKFEDFIYVNFDKDTSVGDIFKRSKDPKKILFELSLIYGRTIKPESTLIFFDEIQSCNEALNALKYFCEAEDSYYVIGAGSYLGITLSQGASFPVGKVDMVELHPMTYKEFLIALGEDLLVEYIENVNEVDLLSEPVFEKLNNLLREYYMVGGMPEAVSEWCLSKDIEQLESIQNNIINAYYRDFSKYPPPSMVPKIVGIWGSIVSQLSRENRKFKYSEISKGARAREYESALEWIIAGNYLSKVTKIDKMNLPLKGYENQKHFKTYLPDIGLLRKMSDYPVSTLLQMEKGNNIPFKGAMAENYVLQELKATYDKGIYYWSNDRYEMDFVIQDNEIILPIEVKAGINIRSKSMSKLMEEMPLGIRYSMKNLSYSGKILNIPLALAGETLRLYKIIK